ncbi:MAG: hypothetical protein NTY38_29605 [Acidobacteria bacterium]|nr:hypothetical protein [Acidobacteriota bacterium]
MARPKSVQDESLLAAALEGLELQKKRIEEQIAQVRALLAGRRSKTAAAPVPAVKAPRKRELSEAARKRIAAAQKRRWAEYRKKSAGKQDA